MVGGLNSFMTEVAIIYWRSQINRLVANMIWTSVMKELMVILKIWQLIVRRYFVFSTIFLIGTRLLTLVSWKWWDFRNLLTKYMLTSKGFFAGSLNDKKNLEKKHHLGEASTKQCSWNKKIISKKLKYLRTTDAYG